MAASAYPGLDIATYLVALVYILNFLALSAAISRQAGRSVWLFRRSDGDGQLWTAWAFRVSFATAFLWPGIRLVAQGFGVELGLAAVVPGWFVALIGHFLVAAGAAIALLSQYHMGQSWRIGAAEGEQGPELVETGPFAFSRNPVFVGQALLLVGLVAAFPDLLQLAATALALVAMVAQVRIEERVMQATFAERYSAYSARVRRWI